MSPEIIREEIAFEGEKRGYKFVATYLTQPSGDALIEITKNEKVVREFLFPAYKIWNIAAHADDIIDGLEQESDKGLFIAGSDGSGGNLYEPLNYAGLDLSANLGEEGGRR